jgi:hypothetical protein
MPTWTAKQMADLDNSMVAAQNVSLGTALGTLVANSVKSGVASPTLARFPVSTGLTSVCAVMCSLSGSPTQQHMWSVIAAGSVAGDILINSYKPSASASIVTPIAATAPFSDVNWIAIGK